MSYFSLKFQIREKLLNEPSTRDNDNVLIAHILSDIESFQLRSITAKVFLDNVIEGKYGSFESIRRCRQALQEKCPELRGKLYAKRHGYKEEVKQQLKFEF